MSLRTGQVLQRRYRIVSLLGQGGMGAVYRAWDTRLNVSVALKEMIPQPGLDHQTLRQLRSQFQQEAQVMARLSHPHLARVTDFFGEGNSAYLVMDFVDGESLADRIRRQGSMQETAVLAWAAQLLDALAYCHSQGIIHRDIKPQNVVIRPDGQAVLVDFGLVKLWDPYDPATRTAMRGMGTPEYAPPEQYDATAGHTDPRSDLYSLGAALYHALTGQAPPTATMRIATPNRFQTPRTVNPYVSPRMEAVILRATELAVERRFTSAQEMAAALAGRIPMPTRAAAPVAQPYPQQQTVQQVQPTGPVTAPPPAAPARRKGTPIGLWVLGGLAAVVLVVAVTAGVLLALGGIKAATPATQDEDSTPTVATAASVEEPSETPTLSTPATTAPSPTATTEPATPTPTSTPSPTPTPTPRPTTPPPPGAQINFEEWGTWQRGDQPHGEMVQTQDQVHTGSYAAELTYDFPATEEDFVVFANPVSLSEQPNRMSVWVYGDGSGHYLNIWIKDNQEQVWSVHMGEVGGEGWQKLAANLDPSQPRPSGHISGPNNGRIDYPVQFYALVLDRPGSGPLGGKIYLDDISIWRREGDAAPAATRRPATPRPAQPTATPTSEPVESAGPLDFPVPTYLNGWTPVEEGRHRAEIHLNISGGAPPFKVYHDATLMGETGGRFFNLTFVTGGCTLVHSITVESADGQQVSHNYYIEAPGCD